MTETYLSYELPNVSREQRESAEIAKLIRKLRWIGKEDDAMRVERKMRQVPLPNRASVLAEPLSTD
jgi:hypothetical protein